MAVISQTYQFVQGAIPTATQWNSNFVTLFSAFSNIDQNNIGPNGILASQIKPSGVTQATFGGSAQYTFNNGVQAVQGGAAGPLPPTYTNGGVGVASTLHQCFGTITLSTVTSGANTSSAVSLTGASVFSSSSSYIAFAQLQGGAVGGAVLVIAQPISTSSFIITIYNNSGTTITSPVVAWFVIGT
jgi:hypothetical protein